MRREKMQLTLRISTVMDRWAKKNKEEHNKLRLSRRARTHYEPSRWSDTRVKIHGRVKETKLSLCPAPSEEIKKLGPKNARMIGFVTSKTFNYLMGKTTNSLEKAIWVSESAQEITVGCDPEFALVSNSGELKYADHLFTGSDKYGPFGSDGPCAELRPAPSNSIEELVGNMRNLLTENAHKIEEYQWLGGAVYGHPSMSRTYYMGGHIHFGLPPGAGYAEESVQARAGRILDEFVAVPMVRIDTPTPDKRRTIPCGGTGKVYGAFGDLIGGEYKFEWRVPSGIWLVHPELTHCVLTTSKAIVEEVWRRFEDKNKSKEFMMNTSGTDNLQHSFQCEDSEKIRTLVNHSKISDVSVTDVRKIHDRFKGMATYSKYKSEIDEFIKICCSKSMPLPKQKLELRNGWINNNPL